MSAEELETGNAWSANARLAATLILVAWLSLVVIGPLSNPFASQHLTAPAGRLAAPFHQAMFFGHGYRFFGPDPGPSHIVSYRITDSDGELVEGHFPDREQHRPRLMYHRWFMLSETIYQEYVNLYAVPFEEVEAELDRAVLAMKVAGKHAAADTIAMQKEMLRRQFDDSKSRFEQLVKSTGEYLQKQHGVDPTAGRLELFLSERAIAPPLDVVAGINLDDPRYLTEPFQIWPLPPLPEPTLPLLEPMETGGGQ